MKQDVGSTNEASYYGEWSDTFSVTIAEPEVEGRGIMETKADASAYISIGNFDNGVLEGWGLLIEIANYKIPTGE